MKTARKGFSKSKSAPPQVFDTSIGVMRLSKTTTTPPLEWANAPSSSSIESRPTQPTATDVLTLDEAAVLLRCHPKTLRKQAAARKVPGKRVGSLWRFYRRIRGMVKKSDLMYPIANARLSRANLGYAQHAVAARSEHHRG